MKDIAPFRFEKKAGSFPVFLISLFLGCQSAFSQSVVFEANFNASVAASGSVTANATKLNLDAGTSVGDWTVAVSAPGAVISDGASNNAFVFDKAVSALSSNSVTANLSRSVDLYTETLSLEMDLYAVRQAGNQAVLFSLDDANGNKAFEFVFQMNNNKKMFTTDTSGTASFEVTNTTGINNAFKNPAVDGHLTWGSGTMIRVKLDIFGPSDAALSIDWNADGDFADASEWMEFDFDPRTNGVTEISSLRISNYSTTNGGAWIDNAKITADNQVAASNESINLAKYQATVSDSNATSWPPQYATDGFVAQDSRWVSTGSGPHWIEIELAVPMAVGSAHLYSGGMTNGAMSNCVLQYHDGNSWVDIGGTTLSGNSSSIVNLAFTNPVTAQKFRLSTTDGTARVIELALYPPTPGGVPVPFGTDVDLNLAKMRQYDFSSIDGTNYPKLAIDGFAHNRSAWASEDATGPHDLEIHFPHSEKIGGIHLYTGYAGQTGSQIQDFEVAYDDGSGNWVVFNGGAVSGNTDLDLSIEFGTAVATKKIRFRSLDSAQAIVRELVVLPEFLGTWFPLGTDAQDEAPPKGSFLDYEDSYFTIENGAAGANLSSSDTGSTLTAEKPLFQVLLNLGGDSYRIRSRETKKCFEVSLASTADGAAIIEGAYSSMPHQRWEIEPVDDTYVRIVNVWSGLVLGLSGSEVVQETPDGSANQNWKINYETHYPKKGQASHFHFSSLFNSSWGYRWNYNEEDQLLSGQYMPMQWGGMAAASPGIWRHQPKWYGRANQTTVMGFNEPNLPDQANMTVETAIYQWPRLERMRLPLLGPCDSRHSGSWRVAFEAAADEQGLRSPYSAVHWYSNGANGSPNNLINVLTGVYNTYGKPVWLTEFSTRDFSGTQTSWSRDDNYNFLAEFMWRAEKLPWLKKYSVFEWDTNSGNPATDDTNSADPTIRNSPRLGLHLSNDSADPGWEDLSECGLLLAGWDGDTTIRNEKPYIIHNKGRKRRLIDHPNASTIESANVLHRIATEQFVLQAGPGERKYIVGISDGRRLHYNGSSVGLSPAGTTGTHVEWQLAEHQHGWFYINHPSTGNRLRIDGSDNITVSQDTVADNNVRFRFISPTQPISIAEVQALPYTESFEEGIGAWRQFYDDGYDWELGSGGTPSPAAGPSGASDGEYYLFAEGHDSKSADDINQVECVFDFSTVASAEISFDYHMYGAYIDYLAVDVFDGVTWTNDVWVKNNAQHTSSSQAWTRADVDLSAYAGNSAVTIRFRTARKVYNSADPAIDNIVVRERARTLPYVETFESGFGSWTQVTDDDIDWTRHSGGTPSDLTGPARASEGTSYVYFEGHDSGVEYKSASLQCRFDLSSVAKAQMTFDYHMYGLYVDYLKVDVFDGTSWTYDVWRKDDQQHASSSDPWSTAVVDLSSFAGNEEVTILFTHKQKQWHAADTAVDFIRVDVPPLTPFENWAATAFIGAPEGFDMTEGGNSDGDVYTNIEEWVLVLDPLLRDSPDFSTTEDGATFVLNYSRRTVGGFEVRAAWSTTLLENSWRYDGDGLTEMLLSTVGDVEEMIASVPMDGPEKFIRLEVWEVPD